MKQANKKPSIEQVMLPIAVGLNQLCLTDGLGSTEGCLLVYSPYIATATSEFGSYEMGVR
jgi:hypothetical protein